RRGHLGGDNALHVVLQVHGDNAAEIVPVHLEQDGRPLRDGVHPPHPPAQNPRGGHQKDGPAQRDPPLCAATPPVPSHIRCPPRVPQTRGKAYGCWEASMPESYWAM